MLLSYICGLPWFFAPKYGRILPFQPERRITLFISIQQSPPEDSAGMFQRNCTIIQHYSSLTLEQNIVTKKIGCFLAITLNFSKMFEHKVKAFQVLPHLQSLMIPRLCMAANAYMGRMNCCHSWRQNLHLCTLANNVSYDQYVAQFHDGFLFLYPEKQKSSEEREQCKEI